MEDPLFLLKQKIIKTDAVLRLLADKKKENNTLIRKLQALNSKFLAKEQERNELNSMLQEYRTRLQSNILQLAKLPELKVQYDNLMAKYNTDISNLQLKYQQVNFELQKCKEKSPTESGSKVENNDKNGRQAKRILQLQNKIKHLEIALKEKSSSCSCQVETKQYNEKIGSLKDIIQTHQEREYETNKKIKSLIKENENLMNKILELQLENNMLIENDISNDEPTGNSLNIIDDPEIKKCKVEIFESSNQMDNDYDSLMIKGNSDSTVKSDESCDIQPKDTFSVCTEVNAIKKENDRFIDRKELEEITKMQETKIDLLNQKIEELQKREVYVMEAVERINKRNENLERKHKLCENIVEDGNIPVVSKSFINEDLHMNHYLASNKKRHKENADEYVSKILKEMKSIPCLLTPIEDRRKISPRKMKHTKRHKYRKRIVSRDLQNSECGSSTKEVLISRRNCNFQVSFSTDVSDSESVVPNTSTSESCFEYEEVDTNAVHTDLIISSVYDKLTKGEDSGCIISDSSDSLDHIKCLIDNKTSNKMRNEVMTKEYEKQLESNALNVDTKNILRSIKNTGQLTVIKVDSLNSVFAKLNTFVNNSSGEKRKLARYLDANSKRTKLYNEQEEFNKSSNNQIKILSITSTTTDGSIENSYSKYQKKDESNNLCLSSNQVLQNNSEEISISQNINENSSDYSKVDEKAFNSCLEVIEISENSPITSLVPDSINKDVCEKLNIADKGKTDEVSSSLIDTAKHGNIKQGCEDKKESNTFCDAQIESSETCLTESSKTGNNSNKEYKKLCNEADIISTGTLTTETISKSLNNNGGSNETSNNLNFNGLKVIAKERLLSETIENSSENQFTNDYVLPTNATAHILQETHAENLPRNNPEARPIRIESYERVLDSVFLQTANAASETALTLNDNKEDANESISAADLFGSEVESDVDIVRTTSNEKELIMDDHKEDAIKEPNSVLNFFEAEVNKENYIDKTPSNESKLIIENDNKEHAANETDFRSEVDRQENIEKAPSSEYELIIRDNNRKDIKNLFGSESDGDEDMDQMPSSEKKLILDNKKYGSNSNETNLNKNLFEAEVDGKEELNQISSSEEELVLDVGNKKDSSNSFDSEIDDEENTHQISSSEKELIPEDDNRKDCSNETNSIKNLFGPEVDGKENTDQISSSEKELILADDNRKDGTNEFGSIQDSFGSEVEVNEDTHKLDLDEEESTVRDDNKEYVIKSAQDLFESGINKRQDADNVRSPEKKWFIEDANKDGESESCTIKDLFGSESDSEQDIEITKKVRKRNKNLQNRSSNRTVQAIRNALKRNNFSIYKCPGNLLRLRSRTVSDNNSLKVSRDVHEYCPPDELDEHSLNTSELNSADNNEANKVDDFAKPKQFKRPVCFTKRPKETVDKDQLKNIDTANSEVAELHHSDSSPDNFCFQSTNLNCNKNCTLNSNAVSQEESVEDIITEELNVPDDPNPGTVTTRQKKTKPLVNSTAISFIKMLLNYPRDEKVVETVYQKFVNQKPTLIAKIVLQIVASNIREKPDRKYTPPAPVMTQTQRVLLGFMDKLENAGVHVLEIFLKFAEQYLLHQAPPEQIDPITRLYVAVCKQLKQLKRIRLFCCDALYFMDRFVPFFYTVLSNWFEVLPLECESADLQLARVIVQIVLSKPIDTSDINLNNLKVLLNIHHGYPKEKYSENEFFQQLLSTFRAQPTDVNAFTILLLCKRSDPVSVQRQIINQLVPLIHDDAVDNVTKEMLTALTKRILSQFDGNKHAKLLQNIQASLRKDLNSSTL